jgi:predicted permease
MSLLDALRYRWRVLTRPAEHVSELADDVEFFIRAEAAQQKHAARGGLSTDEARDVASRRFGNRTYYREEARRVSGLTFFDVLAQDVRFAVRMFGRARGFTAIAVATLAIGIGANTALFSAADTLLLSPLPFRQPERLMNVTLTLPPTAGSNGRADLVWSHPKVEAFRESQNAFSDLTAWVGVQSTLRIGDDALRLTGEFVDQYYFQTLGVLPTHGRAMLPTENRVDGPPVAIISDDLWRAAFNRDPAIVGKTIGIDLATFTIIGVAPPNFTGVSGNARFWIPFLSAPSAWDRTYFADPYQHAFHVIGRLAPGVTPLRATTIVRELGRRIDARYPDRGPITRHWGADARALDATRLDLDGRRMLVLLFGAVGMVLLIACANVANLFLVRAEGRRREIAVRLAIGASRSRLVRQLLVESVLLALSGGLASILVAAIGVRVISSARPALWGSQSASGIGTVFVGPIHLNLQAFAFAGAIAIGVGLLFGLAPAIQTTRPELSESLKSDASNGLRGGRPRRASLREALAVLEIALAVVLLAGSGVLVRSLVNLVGVSPGFEPNGVLTMRVNRAAAWSRDSISRFYDVATERLRGIPGVTGVTIADCAPQSGGCVGEEVTVLDHGTTPWKSGAGMHWVTADWSNVLRVPLLRGRAIGDVDRKSTPRVVVVSETAARQFWPNEDAIGRRLIVEGRDTATVVGVVGDVRYYDMRLPPKPDIYVSYYQFPMSFRMTLLLRANGDPAALAETVRRALREVAPGFPVYDVATLDDRMGDSFSQTRFLARLLSVFALLSLILATIGAYGVISYGVARRTREMGIRLALGATQRDVVRLVVRQGAALAVLGGSLGVVGALTSAGILRNQLFAVAPTDPVTLAAIFVLLLLVVVAASWRPAHRAASVPTVEALKGS